MVALSIVAVVSWGAAVYFRIAPEGSPLIIRRSRAAPTVTAVPTQGVTATSTVASGSAAPTAPASSSAATATASSTAAAAASGDPTASSGEAAPPTGDAAGIQSCVASLFPEGTFESGDVDFSFLCTESDPRKGLTAVQAQVVAGRGRRGGVTPGMRAWSHLNWYRLAAFAVMRGHCCESTPDLEWSMQLPCPFHEAVGKLEAAIRAKDAKATDGALGYYTTTARCLAKAGMARAFEFAGMPGTGALELRKMMARR